MTFAEFDLPYDRNLALSNEELPPRLRNLIGTRVRFVGWISLNPDKWGKDNKISEFYLRRDHLIPDSGPSLYRDQLYVWMQRDGAFEHSTRPIALEGILGLYDIADRKGNTITVFSLRDARLVRTIEHQ